MSLLEAEPMPSPRLRTRHLGPLRLEPHHQAGLAVFVVLAGVLVARNPYLFGAPRYEDSDFALNSLLIDRAQRLDLSIGNYSRAGFNHPGPALLYVQALGEVLFHDLIPVFNSPFQAHVFSTMLLGAGFVGLAATLLVRATGTVAAAAWLTLAVSMAGTVEPGLLSSSWMPDVYVWPFLVLLVATGTVLAGHTGDLPVLAVALGTLVHGHVSFVMFALVFAAGVLCWLAWRRRLGEAWPRRPLVTSAAILVVFALPIAAHLIRNWPGDLERYLDYSNSDIAGGHGIGSAIDFVGDRWATTAIGKLIALAAVVATVLLARRSGRNRRLFFGLLAAAALATALTVVYAVRGVDDLTFDYTIWFSYAIPVVVATVGATVLTFHLTRDHLALGVAGLAVVTLAITSDGLANPFPGVTWVPDAYDAMVDEAGGTRFIVDLDYPSWKQGAALLQYGLHRGDDVCQPEYWFDIQFTPQNRCSDIDRATLLWIVVRTPDEAIPGYERAFYRSEDVVLTRYVQR